MLQDKVLQRRLVRLTMSALTFYQHSSTRSSHCNKARKRNKMYTYWNARNKIKLSLFGNDMIVYKENPKGFPKIFWNH